MNRGAATFGKLLLVTKRSRIAHYLEFSDSNDILAYLRDGEAVLLPREPSRLQQLHHEAAFYGLTLLTNLVCDWLPHTTGARMTETYGWGKRKAYRLH